MQGTHQAPSCKGDWNPAPRSGHFLRPNNFKSLPLKWLQMLIGLFVCGFIRDKKKQNGSVAMRGSGELGQ
jgi:hypothetical protein